MASDALATSGLRWLTAEDQYALVSTAECADALEAALTESPGVDGWTRDPPRTSLATRNGQLLVMPSTCTDFVGIKLVTVADPSAQSTTARIQGVHVQFDAQTLAPRAVLDGIALTNIRTAAVSVVALRALAVPSSSELLVFGSGPQASAHIRAICASWPISAVRVVSRRYENAQRCATELAIGLEGIDVRAVTPDVARLDDADIVVCATTAETPVFVTSPHEGAAVIAVGSHSPTARELPGALLRRSYVCVEDRETALREAGDIVMAISEGYLTAMDIDADLRELVQRGQIDVSGPRVFKSVGMPWQDAVVAGAILARA